MRRTRIVWACTWPLLAAALPLAPRSDDEVVERLSTPRLVARKAAAAPHEAALQAQQLLQQARAQGDARLAGRALALLRPWADDPNAAPETVLALATTEQYVHQFDRAVQRLETLLARDPNQPQGWLMLATLRRLQGRYELSDQACDGLAQRGPATAVHALGCRAENQALRGRHEAARRSFQALLAQPLDPVTRGWLLTSLAELEERAGHPDAAEKTFVLALQATPGDAYATLALADLLIAQRRAPEALQRLQDQPRSDPVLLRRVRAGQLAHAASTAADAAELRERYAQAALREGAFVGHDRERAMYAWWVQNDLPAALRYAKENLQLQREPIDLLLLAQIAKAGGDAAAARDAEQLAHEIGLADRRLDALR